MKIRGLMLAVLGVTLVLGGCSDDDGPMQPGDTTVSVWNATKAEIHVEYSTQTWDALWPDMDVDHTVSKDISPGQEAQLSVHFGNQMGSSRIKVTQGGYSRDYDIAYGVSTLVINDGDLAK